MEISSGSQNPVSLDLSNSNYFRTFGPSKSVKNDSGMLPRSLQFLEAVLLPQYKLFLF